MSHVKSLYVEVLRDEYEGLLAQVDTLAEWYSNALDACRRLEAERDALRTALAEARYRIEQGRVWAGTEYQLTGLHPHGQQKALDVIDAAMEVSQ